MQLEAIGKNNGYDREPQIAAVGSSGAFVVTWQGQDSAFGDGSIYVQKFDADGQPVPGAVLVNPGMPVYVRSSEAGTAYLVQSSVTATTLADITSAADALWNQVAITAANTDTTLPTTGLGDGIYRLYTADAAGNLSAPSGTVTVDSAAPLASAFTATATAVGATSNENGTLGLYDASHQLLAKTGGGTLSTVLTAGTAATITVEAQAHITSATLKVSDAAGKFASDSRTVVLGTNAHDAALVGTNNADFIFGFAGVDTLTGGAGADRFVYAASDAGSWTFYYAGSDGPYRPVQGSWYFNLEVITDFNIGGADTLVLGNASLSSVDIGGPGAQADDIVVVYGQYSIGTFTVGDQATSGVTNGDAIVLWDGSAAGGLQLEAVVLVGVDLSKTPTLSGLKELTFA